MFYHYQLHDRFFKMESLEITTRRAVALQVGFKKKNNKIRYLKSGKLFYFSSKIY